MEMKIDGNLSVHQRTSRFRSDVKNQQEALVPQGISQLDVQL
ncbi:hypothetical protein T03_11380 [Trichinella britovi]|uniref:Uncharacterized protein n=1 Tax=Trichinella britovi TaxID=45882 RepID=A0A0V1BA68_TRIBR|nr:hypothetical protein T03_11380 [Trichinella britovi]